MEHWRPETNTFHMYHGEVSITLQDVAHLTGLSVSGDALYVEYDKETNWVAIVEEVLGRAFLMPDRSSVYVHCQYLLAFREQRPFAWGAAVLFWMYRELGRVVFKIEGGPTRAWRNWWMDGATAGMVSAALLQHCTEDARARPQTTSESDSTSYS
ncbi:Serine/threonine-protein phosphatase 7 long form homolog [Linum grandiflorum]